MRPGGSKNGFRAQNRPKMRPEFREITVAKPGGIVTAETCGRPRPHERAQARVQRGIGTSSRRLRRVSAELCLPAEGAACPGGAYKQNERHLHRQRLITNHIINNTKTNNLGLKKSRMLLLEQPSTKVRLYFYFANIF